MIIVVVIKIPASSIDSPNPNSLGVIVSLLGFGLIFFQNFVRLGISIRSIRSNRSNRITIILIFTFQNLFHCH